MAIDYRVGTKVEKSQRREEAAATRVDPHPYIGIVKNNLDPTRCGRLQVWIPDLGGNPTDPKNWRTVSYASPFMGTTDIAEQAAGSINKDNKFTNVPHTYGMWMVPPDVGVEVIVLFIGGDPLRGYWLACVNSHLSRYMMPGLAGSTNVDTQYTASDVKSTYQNQQVPVTEFNENAELAQKADFYNNKKPIHEPQYRILKEQGLDRDSVRGSITSSSQRESPSAVFGISTPGRPLDDPADDPQFLTKVANGTLTEDDYRYTTRQGGHTFIMDDGNVIGKDQLVRLRTSRGHQIMMHDTENTLYISHADGTSWIELTPEGTINAFSAGGMNVRTKGTLNLHADQDINIAAVENLNLRAGNKLQLNSITTNVLQSSLNIESTGITQFAVGGSFVVDAGSKISLKAAGVMALEGSTIKQNSGGTVAAKGVDNIPVVQLSDTSRSSGTELWVNKPASLASIVTVAPSHEPFNREEAITQSVIAANKKNVGIQPGTYKGTNDATKSVTGTSFSNPAGDKDLRNQPTASQTVGNLTTDQMTAYNAQIGKSESGGDYTAVNTLGYVGKYQMGYKALQDLGYVKKSVTSNAQLNNPNSWTGKDGIDSSDKFLASPDIQESAMGDYTKRNYNAMVANGAITADMPPEDVGGMLATAHLLGAGGANSWRNGAGGADAYGTTGSTYFQKGKYAISVLAPKVATIDSAPTT